MWPTPKTIFVLYVCLYVRLSVAVDCCDGSQCARWCCRVFLCWRTTLFGTFRKTAHWWKHWTSVVVFNWPIAGKTSSVTFADPNTKNTWTRVDWINNVIQACSLFGRRVVLALHECTQRCSPFSNDSLFHNRLQFLYCSWQLHDWKWVSTVQTFHHHWLCENGGGRIPSKCCVAAQWRVVASPSDTSNRCSLFSVPSPITVLFVKKC